MTVFETLRVLGLGVCVCLGCVCLAACGHREARMWQYRQPRETMQRGTFRRQSCSSVLTRTSVR